MTFFGYAVSDATRSWLLYQGMLFVLVMMFLPTGLTGLFDAAARLASRRGWPVTLSVSALAVHRDAVLGGGRGLRRRDVAAPVLAGLSLARRDGRRLATDRAVRSRWSPWAITTWLVPVTLLVTAATLGWAARRWMASSPVQAPDAATAPGREQALS